MGQRIVVSLLCSFVSAALLLSSCARPATALSPSNAQPPPASKMGSVDQNVTYGIADGVELKMDIYYPASATKAVPAVLYVHGGGWITGAKPSLEIASQGIFAKMLSRGYIMAAIDYRLAPEYKFPAQIEDTKCAVRFLSGHASEYGIDPTHIGAIGESAGGHLVALLGVTDSKAGFEGNGGNQRESSRVQAVVDLFGPTDLVTYGAASQLRAVFGTSDRESEVLVNASPVTWVSKDDPPFLILHGDMDNTVPLDQSQTFYDRLVKSDVPATLVVVKNAGHGFQPVGGTVSPSPSELSTMTADFFDRYLK